MYDVHRYLISSDATQREAPVQHSQLLLVEERKRLVINSASVVDKGGVLQPPETAIDLLGELIIVPVKSVDFLWLLFRFTGIFSSVPLEETKPY
jgi:hypothetical protein